MNAGIDSIDQILASCLESLERGEKTLDRCLADHPEYREELEGLVQTASLIQAAPPLTPRLAFRRSARARLLNRLPDPPRQPSFRERLAITWRNLSRPAGSRLALALVAILVSLGFLFSAGVAYAADRAVPGDLLYPLDRAMEDLRLALALNPEQAIHLQLSYAGERLGEAARLASAGEEENLESALSSYELAISRLAEDIGQLPAEDQAALLALLQSALDEYNDQLQEIIQDLPEEESIEPPVEATGTPGEGEPEGEPPVEVAPKNDSARCDTAAYRPVADDLAATYQADAGAILDWFCKGYGFGEIMLALETSAETGVSAEELLNLKQELGGWGQVWKELGLKGKPDDAGPGDENGPLEDAGPPDSPGNSDKPPKDKKPKDENGPPEDAGPPEGAGKPADKPDKKP